MAGSIIFRKNDIESPTSNLDESIFEASGQTWLERMAIKHLDAKSKSKMTHAGLRAPFDLVIYWLIRPTLAIFLAIKDTKDNVCL